MNRVLWQFRARDEEPTLHDVVDLLEEVLIQNDRQKERTLKLHERLSQMAYEVGRNALADRKEFVELLGRLSNVEREISAMKNLFEKDKIIMKFSTTIPN